MNFNFKKVCILSIYNVFVIGGKMLKFKVLFIFFRGSYIIYDIERVILNKSFLGNFLAFLYILKKFFNDLCIFFVPCPLLSKTKNLLQGKHNKEHNNIINAFRYYSVQAQRQKKLHNLLINYFLCILFLETT